MSSSLLPSSASPYMTTLEAASSFPLDAIDPSAIESLWDAWRCPSGLLPWLAWAMSVDYWVDAWPEVRKRQAIADSPYYHRIKGTRLAVEMAVALSNRSYSITEWFELFPVARRGTFRVHIEADVPDVAPIIGSVLPAVMSAKPKSRGVFLGVGPKRTGEFVCGAGILVETLITVAPYSLGDQERSGSIVVGAGILADELVTISPAT